jgi:hypothetical protein
MRKKLIFLSISLWISFALSGCMGNETSPTPADLGSASGEILFQDDFSDPDSGWDRVQGSSGMADYDLGGYRIQVNQENFDILATPGRNYQDTSVEVNAVKIGGPDENDFGIVCRYQDPENFYFFVISSDGFWGIGIEINGQELQLVGMTDMQFSRLIQQGEATNQIRADCSGNRLTMYVNGRILESVTDNRLDFGDVGLIAGAFDTPGTDILFTDYVVRSP